MADDPRRMTDEEIGRISAAYANRIEAAIPDGAINGTVRVALAMVFAATGFPGTDEDFDAALDAFIYNARAYRLQCMVSGVWGGGDAQSQPH